MKFIRGAEWKSDVENDDKAMSHPTIKILQGDSVEMLKTIPDESVHLVVTSPPYDSLRTYGGDFGWDFEMTALELYRTLAPGGVLCWNVNDGVEGGSESLSSCRQKIFLREGCGFLIHDTMIYQKRNFSHPEKNRYHQVFEYVFILSKGIPRAFNPLMDRKNITAGCVGNLGVNTFTEADGSKSVRSKKVTAEFGMRHNVWLGNTRGQEEMCVELKHPAMMPEWLARDLILSWSNIGDTVLDPFAGSGTTGRMAIEHNRNTILIEKNPDYIPIINQQLANLTPDLKL